MSAAASAAAGSPRKAAITCGSLLPETSDASPDFVLRRQVVVRPRERHQRRENRGRRDRYAFLELEARVVHERSQHQLPVATRPEKEEVERRHAYDRGARTAAGRFGSAPRVPRGSREGRGPERNGPPAG